MIKIKFYKQKNITTLIKISGHANSDKFGSDLVCSAISAISTGMINALDNLTPDSVNITIENGLIIVTVKKSSSNLQLLLETLWYQFLTVEQQFSQYVSLKEVKHNA